MLSLFIPFKSFCQDFTLPDIHLDVNGSGIGEGDLVLSLKILLLLTVLSLAPSILILLTSFTRIIVVLALIRSALSTQRMPPDHVLIGLAIFLTVFIMAPVWQSINSQAIQPYLNEEINTEEAYQRGIEPLKEFLFKQTREKDLGLFVDLAKMERPQNRSQVPLHVLIPAFVISELKNAFQIGFMIYLPFLMIDMVVASILILLFILVDGWYLVIENLIKTFN